jgi:hypothetical protein
MERRKEALGRSGGPQVELASGSLFTRLMAGGGWPSARRQALPTTRRSPCNEGRGDARRHCRKSHEVAGNCRFSILRTLQDPATRPAQGQAAPMFDGGTGFTAYIFKLSCGVAVRAAKRQSPCPKLVAVWSSLRPRVASVPPGPTWKRKRTPVRSCVAHWGATLHSDANRSNDPTFAQNVVPLGLCLPRQ